MAAVRVVLNPPGVREEILADEGVERHLLSVAEDVASRARQTAPVESGDYRDGIRADVVDGRTRRVAAQVSATVDYALAVESKTRTLGRSL